MPVHVDSNQIEAMLERVGIAARGRSDAPGLGGAMARMSLTVEPAFIRQLVDEVNRGTSSNVIAQALTSSCTNMVVSFVDSVTEDHDQREVLVLRILGMMSRLIARHLAGESECLFSAQVAVQHGGRA